MVKKALAFLLAPAASAFLFVLSLLSSIVFYVFGDGKYTITERGMILGKVILIEIALLVIFGIMFFVS